VLFNNADVTNDVVTILFELSGYDGDIDIVGVVVELNILTV
jgi:hypothetical protein